MEIFLLAIDSQQFSKLEDVIENSNKSENSLRYYTSGELVY